MSLKSDQLELGFRYQLTMLILDAMTVANIYATANKLTHFSQIEFPTSIIFF